MLLEMLERAIVFINEICISKIAALFTFIKESMKFNIQPIVINKFIYPYVRHRSENYWQLLSTRDIILIILLDYKFFPIHLLINVIYLMNTCWPTIPVISDTYLSIISYSFVL